MSSILKLVLPLAAVLSLAASGPSYAAGQNNHGGSISPTACTKNATAGSTAGIGKLGGGGGAKKYLELNVFGEESNAAGEILGIPINPITTFSCDVYNRVNPSAGAGDDNDLQLVVLGPANAIAKVSFDTDDAIFTPLGHGWTRITVKPQSIINEFEGLTILRAFINCDGPNGNTGTANDFLISNITVNGKTVPNGVFSLSPNAGSCIYLEAE